MIKKYGLHIIVVSFICIVSLIPNIFEFHIPDTIVTSTDNYNFPVIIIDAGHGGYDPGAVIGDILEKDINLSIAKVLNEQLLAFGFNTVMTRTEDVALHDYSAKNKKQSDLDSRLKIINTQADALVISVHQNMFSQSKYFGSQVFYGNSEGSSEFAEILQNNIINYLQKDNHRKIKSGEYLYLLDNSEHPSVMLECGFMSNSNDLNKLVDITYQRQLSYVIAISILEHIKSYT